MKKFLLLISFFFAGLGLGSKLLAADVPGYGAIGAKAVLTASADGTPPITFEWFKDGNKIADGPTLTIEKLAAEHAGAYTVKASNQYGSATSADRYVLAVGDKPSPPVIKATFTAIIAPKQSNVAMGATVIGASKLQWLKNDSPIIGATRETFVIAKVNPSHAGIYSLRASNDAGSELADIARLIVR